MPGTVQKVYASGDISAGTFILYRGQMRRVEAVQGDTLSLDNGAEWTLNDGDVYEVTQGPDQLPPPEPPEE